MFEYTIQKTHLELKLFRCTIIVNYVICIFKLFLPIKLLLRFRPNDTQNGISRSTVERLAEYLGFTGETQVIHYALRKLAKEVLPAYEADDGELTPMQLAAIRKAVPQGRAKSVKSSLF